MWDITDPLAHFVDKPRLHSVIQSSLATLDRAICLYGTQGLSFSFNGGKDSVVVLHLLRAALTHRGHDMSHITNFYFVRKDEFPEIERFVHDADRQFGLQMEYIAGDFKSGIQHLIETTSVKAIVLGTRRGDPNAGQQDAFCPSSAGWPPFMRINPILSWTYDQVWDFLRSAGLPYADLYDRGFTSIGSVHDTKPNEALRNPDAPGEYLPAYLLKDCRLERQGRTAPSWATAQKPPTAPASSPAPRTTPASHLHAHTMSYGNVGSSKVTVTASVDESESELDVEAQGAELEGSATTTTREMNRKAPAGAATEAEAPCCVGIVVVGDEILSGRVQDENTGFLLRGFRDLGWQVLEVAIVPDDKLAISRAIRSLLPRADLVVTAGGVGPTIDDVTVQGVAAALNHTGAVTQFPELVERIRGVFGDACTSHHLKMSEVPLGEEIELIDANAVEDVLSYGRRRSQTPSEGGAGSVMEQRQRLETLSLSRGFGPLRDPFPIVKVAKKICLLPGVPVLLRKKFTVLARSLQSLSPFISATIRLATDDETLIAQALTDVMASQASAAASATPLAFPFTLGSYPLNSSIQPDGCGVVLQVESKDAASVEAALAFLKERIPEELWINAKIIGSELGLTGL